MFTMLIYDFMLHKFFPTVKVRLVRNRASSFGRVEIYYNGVRGRACGFNWDLQNGRVICRMLGNSHVFAAGGNRKYGIGNGPIWPSKFQCTGNEKSIVTCQHQGLEVEDCRPYSDAWVVCSNSSGNYNELSTTFLI